MFGTKPRTAGARMLIQRARNLQHLYRTLPRARRVPLPAAKIICSPWRRLEIRSSFLQDLGLRLFLYSPAWWRTGMSALCNLPWPSSTPWRAMGPQAGGIPIPARPCLPGGGVALWAMNWLQRRGMYRRAAGRSSCRPISMEPG